MAECKLGPIRVSYPQLFTPTARDEGEKKKYQITILLPKSNTRSVNALQKAIKQAELEAKDKKFGGKLPAKVKNPVWDGDGVRDNGEEFGPECKGCWVLTATTGEDYPPEVLAGRDGHPARPEEIYAGCWGYVSINLSGYNYKKAKKGIGAYLNSFWKTKEGEPLAGRRKSAHEDFADILNEMEFDDGDDFYDDDFDPLGEDDETVF